VDRLETTIRPYAWGSRTALAQLQGRPAPTDGPEAELWAGAHPGAPSRVVRGGRTALLGDVLAADPAGELGAEVTAEFGPRLPFLLKLLAVSEPLSLQVHPDADQARAGFAAEERAGIPRDAPFRTYRDASPKPELLCAVTPFEALCGFRPVDQTVRLLDRLTDGWGVTPLVRYAEPLRAEGARALRPVVTSLLQLEGPAPDELVGVVGEACAKASSDSDDDSVADVYACVADLARRHPGDPGVVVALLLNHVRLAPGDAIFVPAGSLHAYVHGVGVEIMASSDNVLRGGLTPKHIDPDALLGVLRFEAAEVVPVPPSDDGAGTRSWPTRAREFALARTTLRDVSVRLPAGVPQIVLCLEGQVTMSSAVASLELRGGDAVFVPAGDPEVTLTGPGVVFRATPGRTGT
jgi:mannose-6-phosphate isomerase